MSESPQPERALELGAILLGTTHLTEEQLDEARAAQAANGGRLADHLLSSGRVSADQVLEALSRQLGLPVLPSIDTGHIDEDLIERVPIGFAKTHGILPLQRTADGAVRVAVTNPLETAPLDDLRLLFEDAEVRLELANQRTILGAINEVYDRGATATDALAEDAAEDLDMLANDDQPGTPGPARSGRRFADHQTGQLAACSTPSRSAPAISISSRSRSEAAGPIPDRRCVV